MVIHADVEILPAAAAHPIAGIGGDAVADASDSPEFLGVEVEQIARVGVFVADHRRSRAQLGLAVEAALAQPAAEGGTAQSGS